MNGFTDRFPMPASRYTMNKSADLVAAGLQILAEAVNAVWVWFGLMNGDLFVFNHLEHDAGTLGDEYQRDIKTG